MCTIELTFYFQKCSQGYFYDKARYEISGTNNKTMFDVTIMG